MGQVWGQELALCINPGHWVQTLSCSAAQCPPNKLRHLLSRYTVFTPILFFWFTEARPWLRLETQDFLWRPPKASLKTSCDKHYWHILAMLGRGLTTDWMLDVGWGSWRILGDSILFLLLHFKDHPRVCGLWPWGSFTWTPPCRPRGAYPRLESPGSTE